jgi:hypothetical protein
MQMALSRTDIAGSNTDLASSNDDDDDAFEPRIPLQTTGLVSSTRPWMGSRLRTTFGGHAAESEKKNQKKPNRTSYIFDSSENENETTFGKPSFPTVRDGNMPLTPDRTATRKFLLLWVIVI